MKPLDATDEFRVRDRFLADHRKIEDLFQQVLDAFAADDRERVASLWTDFDATLMAHMDAEERYFIPGLLQTNARGARAILEEHKHFRVRLMVLAAEVDLHLIRLREARSFIDELRAHAAHEDKVLYTWADQHLEEGKRASALGALVSSVKARLLAQTGIVP